MIYLIDNFRLIDVIYCSRDVICRWFYFLVFDIQIDNQGQIIFYNRYNIYISKDVMLVK